MIMKRTKTDCERLRALHAKSGGYPYPPNNPAHTAYGMTVYPDDVRVDPNDGKNTYDMPTDQELGPRCLARLTGAEQSELAVIRAKPDV